MSILTPDIQVNYNTLSDITMHDLGLDVIIGQIAQKKVEKDIIKRFMSNISSDPRVAKYRSDVFEDLLNFPEMRVRMVELLEQIDFLRSYGTFKAGYEEGAGAWDLLHRLGEISDYIKCIVAMHDCLSGVDIKSEGLINLRKYIEDQFDNQGFAELKKDIEKLKADTSNLKSVTLGINLNDRFEAESVGLISINSKAFSKAGILSNLGEKLSTKDNINNNPDWNEDYRYTHISSGDTGATDTIQRVAQLNMAFTHPLLTASMNSMAGVPEGDNAAGATQYLDKVASHMISLSVKRLREILRKYVSISLQDISNLIPEFTYYIRWADYIEKLQSSGVKCVKPQALEDGSKDMRARGIFNLKLLELAQNDMSSIITNDLDFSDEHRTYILTGANRGGKTTITQAIGQLFVLAQGGIFVPGEEFAYAPVDNIFTHFPADEDKTLDLGRLGEECLRFKELYQEATEDSLLLLNETFSTTSFEEGYYIARDAVKAILEKGTRTIYNTHMHKLGYEVDEINAEIENIAGKAASLIVKAEGGQRSYKVCIAPPEGSSYASDIAKKYGVTYEQLV